MEKLEHLDHNFLMGTAIDKPDIRFYDIENAPFQIYGIFKENDMYRRMPQDIAKTVSEGVFAFHTNTAGGRVRFQTDSRYIAIHAEMDEITKLSRFALTGSVGFDLYVGTDHTHTFVPPFDIKDNYSGLFEWQTNEMREITIHFPLYSNVKSLYIGVEDQAVLKEASLYKNKKPIVFYGSSITHGGCASRPGMSYQAIVSRKFNYDYISLGFSGSALAEDTMAEYIQSLDMAAFVYDYDYNAPSVEHLEKTHEKMFKTIRCAHPTLPIIIMSRPKYRLTDEEKTRHAIIEQTYLNAVSSGDKNVYFIHGKQLTALCKGEGTVDNVHPTDFGFTSMACALSDVLSDINI